MKKNFTYLFLLLVILSGARSAMALKYEEALNQSKPMAVLIYAQWADGAQAMYEAFRAMETRVWQYNFVTIDIASQEAKYFIKKYGIQPNLPYVMVIKEGGKITRVIKNDCVTDSACFTERLRMFNP